MGKSYKQSTPKLLNCIILDHHISGAEVIQQIQDRCDCTFKLHQSDGQIIY